jgi:hypothetical protein
MVTSINEFKKLLENKLVDNILDKINKDGMNSLTYDERTYLQQYNTDKIDSGLEEWLLDDENINYRTNIKPQYYEFDEDDDIFEYRDKLMKIITKSLGKKSKKVSPQILSLGLLKKTLGNPWLICINGADVLSKRLLILNLDNCLF